MKNRRDDLEKGSREPIFRGGHLTEEALLLLLDGELSQPEVEQADAHVHSCWSCRARKDATARGIADFADYQNAFLAPHLPPSPSGKPMFMARLDKLAEELGRPSLLRSWRRAISQFSEALLEARTVWITAVLLVVAGTSFLYLFRQPQTVSANEMLRLASASERHTPAGIVLPVVIQKLRIKSGGHSLTRTIYRDTAHSRTAEVTPDRAETGEVRSAFLRTSFDWNEPLSADGYSRWHSELTDKQDTVERVGSDLLRLDTTSSGGPVAEASLTVRASDYHPVEENLRLRDDGEVKIAEVSYNVVGFASLSPDIFGGPAQPPILKLPVTAAASRVADEAELATTELQVRSTLHNLGADLGEQIEVQPEKDGSVRVEGVAEDDIRRHQLIAALQGIPRTQLRIETVAEAAEHQEISRVSGPARVAVMAGATPLLETSLKQRFPDDDQRTAYVNQTLALTQGASARVWALNRLAERYSPQQVALLDSASRQRLGMLLGDHLSALREEINRLQNQLGQVLSPSSNTAAANTASSKFTPPEMPEHADDWRSHVHRMHSSVETVDESVAVLLTGSSTDEKDDPEAIEIGLRTTLTQLQAELQVLDQQIHKQF
jgi:hypothetical protein